MVQKKWLIQHYTFMEKQKHLETLPFPLRNSLETQALSFVNWLVAIFGQLDQDWKRS